MGGQEKAGTGSYGTGLQEEKTDAPLRRSAPDGSAWGRRGGFVKKCRKTPVFAILAIELIVLCAPLGAQTPHEAAQKFFKDYFDAKLRDEPEFATGTGHYENADKWNDSSKAGRERHRTSTEETLGALDKLPMETLPEEDQLSARLLRYQLRAELDSMELETYLLRVGQLYGAHNRVFLTIDRMPARTVRDYQNILGRLHGVPVYVDQNIGILNEAIERGIVQP